MTVLVTAVSNDIDSLFVNLQKPIKVNPVAKKNGSISQKNIPKEATVIK